MRYVILSALAVVLSAPAMAQSSSDETLPQSAPHSQALKKPATSDPAGNVNVPDPGDSQDNPSASEGASAGESGMDVPENPEDNDALENSENN
ncbi:hypothetical protein [Hyphomicrobium sp.]|uniref:hypothetical protein n=1 Tax=Hyphomicrobium sp. TaxID=82 RepID=UPI002E30B92D|nr:hypothetical protein [Hyphomicrobium sp.]HEX2840195.1 hypothetical protein [Hyphomicrobium sp.]